MAGGDRMTSCIGGIRSKVLLLLHLWGPLNSSVLDTLSPHLCLEAKGAKLRRVVLSSSSSEFESARFPKEGYAINMTPASLCPLPTKQATELGSQAFRRKCNNVNYGTGEVNTVLHKS